MAVSNPLLLYLRSRLNISVALVSLAAFVAGLLFFRGHAGPVIVGAVLLYAALTTVFFFSRRGAAVVVARAEEDQAAANRRKLDEAAALRQRIAVLRLGDEELRLAVENLLLVSGQYLERARESGTWSPQANDRIRQALEICQIYLGEKDESSTERRYGTADGDEAADVRGRSIAAIRECAAAIRRHALDDLIGLDGTEKLGIIEETEGRK